MRRSAAGLLCGRRRARRPRCSPAAAEAAARAATCLRRRRRSSTATPITVADLADDDAHRAAVDEDVVSRCRARPTGSRCARAPWRRSPTTPSCAPGRTTSASTVKPSAVDAALKQTLAERVPRHDARAASTRTRSSRSSVAPGMTRALLRHRIETKLLAAAAANKVGGNPKITDAQVLAQYDEGQGHRVRPAGAPQGAPHPGQGRGAREPALLAAPSSDADFAALAKQYSTDSTKANGGDLGVVNRTEPRQAVRRRRVHAHRGRRLGARQDPVRLAPDRAHGPDPARRARGRSTPRSRSRSALSSPSRRARSRSRASSTWP